MRGIIIYKGKYGATWQYAQWIGEELGIPLFEAGSENGIRMREADYIILGTSVYIGKLQISKWIEKNIGILKNKKIYLFLVAGTPPHEIDKLSGYIRAGVPEELRLKVETFYLPGRLYIAGLSWKDRFMLKMGARLTKDPNEKKSMLTDYDHVRKDHLTPLFNGIKTMKPGDYLVQKL